MKKQIIILGIVIILVCVGLSGCEEQSIETIDTDDDGYNDDVDVFPNDSTEWNDTDNDGYGDNSDEFPDNPLEWYDNDGDGYGDNEDEFIHDPNEWIDTDGDGFGDNSDEFPNNRSRWNNTLPYIVDYRLNIGNSTPFRGIVDFYCYAEDPDGSIQSYHWDLGDGFFAECNSFMHTYRKLPSHYTVTLTITDNDGGKFIKKDSVKLVALDKMITESGTNISHIIFGNKDKLEISSFYLQTSPFITSHNWRIGGKAKNIDGDLLNQVEIECRLFDRYNNYLGSVYINTQYLPPDEIWNFRKDFNGYENLHEINFHITAN